MRAIAVLLVFWVHLPAGALGERAEAVRNSILAGNLGVDLFFVLSGFLITRILLVDRGAGVPVRYFMARRFFRIFPIYYLTIFALWPLMGRNQSLAALTYTSNYAQLFTPYHSLLEHAWSLAVEEHFYLLWPPVVAWLAPVFSRRVLLAGVIPVALLSLVGAIVWGPWERYPQAMEEFILRSSTVRFLSLAAGAMLAFHESALRNSRPRAAVIVGVFTLAALLLTPGRFGTPDWPGFRFAQFVVMFPCIGCAVLIYAVAWRGSRSPLSAALRWAPLRGIGRVSYALYLYHYPVFAQTGIFGVQPHSPSAVRTVLVMGFCGGLAVLSYYAIERPLLRIGGRFRSVRPSAKGPAPLDVRGDRPASGAMAARWGFAIGFVFLLTWSLQGGAERAVTAAVSRLGGDSVGAVEHDVTLAAVFGAESSEPQLATGDQTSVSVTTFERSLRHGPSGQHRAGCFFDAAAHRLFVDLEFLDRAAAAAKRKSRGSGPWARRYVVSLTLADGLVRSAGGDAADAAELAGRMLVLTRQVGQHDPSSAQLRAAIDAAHQVFGEVEHHLPTGWTQGRALERSAERSGAAAAFERGLRSGESNAAPQSEGR